MNSQHIKQKVTQPHVQQRTNPISLLYMIGSVKAANNHCAKIEQKLLHRFYTTAYIVFTSTYYTHLVNYKKVRYNNEKNTNGCIGIYYVDGDFCRMFE